MGRPTSPGPTAPRLPPAAVVFRVAHAVVAAGFLLAVAHIWRCALTRRRGPGLRVAVGALMGEGVLVLANHGDCPLGGVQGRLGDPVPLFELVLPRRAAERVFPVLSLVTVAGLLVLAARPAPGQGATAKP